MEDALLASIPSTAADGMFRSLPGGLSELVHAIVAALPKDAVRTGVPVRSI